MVEGPVAARQENEEKKIEKGGRAADVIKTEGETPQLVHTGTRHGDVAQFSVRFYRLVQQAERESKASEWGERVRGSSDARILVHCFRNVRVTRDDDGERERGGRPGGGV